MKTITVGMADLNVARDGDRLLTLGLGSCVGVTLYCPISRVGGMAHIMLPSSASAVGAGNIAKFADTALPELVRRMMQMGAMPVQLQGKMAGGAHMFSKTLAKDVIKIGERNVGACRDILTRIRIPLRAEDTGGTFGRTIELDTQNGSLSIKTIGHGVKTI